MALQKQSEEERRQQQNLVRASYGQQRFQDLQKIAGYRRDKVTDRGTSAVRGDFIGFQQDTGVLREPS